MKIRERGGSSFGPSRFWVLPRHVVNVLFTRVRAGRVCQLSAHKTEEFISCIPIVHIAAYEIAYDI